VVLRAACERQPALELAVLGGSWRGGRLELALALENHGDVVAALPGASARELRLVGVDGEESAPLDVSDALEELTLAAGLPGRTRNEGRVVFLVPRAPQRLLLPGFPPLALAPDALPPLPDAPSAGDPRAGAELRAAVEALLAQQSTALMAHDLGRYAATLTPALAAHEGGCGPGARDADVGAVAMRLREPPRSTAPAAAEAVVELAYWLRGLDASTPFVHDLRLHLLAGAGGWRVDALEPAPGDRLPFWCAPRFARVPSEHFLVFSGAGTQQQLMAVAQQAEAAYGRLLSLHLPLQARYAIHVLPHAELAPLVGEGVIGAALARYAKERDAVRIENQALYLDDTLFDAARARAFSAEARREVVTHELVHLALMPRTRPVTPVWLVEGAAMYFSGGVGPDAARRLLASGRRLPSLVALTGARSLVGGSGDARAVDRYDYAGLAVSYVIEHDGMEAFSRLYAAFAALPAERAMGAVVLGRLTRSVDAGAGESTVAAEAQRDEAEAIVARELGTSLAALERDVDDWIRGLDTTPR
jgi:hypothetical protein